MVIELPPMDDPADDALQRTRERSLANRHSFHFIGDGEDAVVAIGKVAVSGERVLQGTGFFVAPGIVATACHVFGGNDVAEDDVFEVWQKRGEGFGARTIVEIVDADPIDVAVCRVASVGETDGSVDWDRHPIAAVVTGGAPSRDDVLGSFTAAHTLVGSSFPLDDHDLAQRIAWRTSWELGTMVEVHPGGFSRLKGHAFQTTIFVDGRGSGGPLFDSTGLVMGMMNTDWSPKNEMPISFGLSIEHVLDLKINGKTIPEHIKAGGRRPSRIAYLQPEDRSAQDN